MSFQCQSEILDILLTCNKMSVVGNVKKNGYPKFRMVIPNFYLLTAQMNSPTYGWQF